MKTQEKSESFCMFPEIFCIRSHYLQDRIFRYPVSTRIIYLSTYNTRCRYSHRFAAVMNNKCTIISAFDNSQLYYGQVVMHDHDHEY